MTRNLKIKILYLSGIAILFFSPFARFLISNEQDPFGAGRMLIIVLIATTGFIIIFVAQHLFKPMSSSVSLVLGTLLFLIAYWLWSKVSISDDTDIFGIVSIISAAGAALSFCYGIILFIKRATKKNLQK